MEVENPEENTYVVVVEEADGTTLTSGNFELSPKLEQLDKRQVKRLIQAKSDLITFKSKEKNARSDIWRSFKIVYYRGHPQKFVICDKCKELFVHDRQKGTSAILKHLHSRCGYRKMRANAALGALSPGSMVGVGVSLVNKTAGKSNIRPATKLQSVSKPSQLRRIPEAMKEEFNFIVAESLSEDLTPFYNIDQIGFRRIAQYLLDIGAMYGKQLVDEVLVSRKCLKETYLKSCYEKRYQEVLSELKTSVAESSRLSFTTDMWTANNKQESYLGLTAHYLTSNFDLKSPWLTTSLFPEEHHTADNIREGMKKIFDSLFEEKADDLWKHSYFVMDSSSNISAAFPNRLACACHGLNLAISNALSDQLPIEFRQKKEELYVQDTGHMEDPLAEAWREEIQGVTKLVGDIKSLVGYMKHSGRNKLLTASLKQYVPGRWNSLLTMLESVQNVYAELEELLWDTEKQEMMQGLDKGLMEELITFLQPFRECCENLSGERKPTLHLVVLWKEKLLKHLGTLDVDSPQMAILRNRAQKCLSVCFKVTYLHYIACFLNPSCRKLKFMDKTFTGQLMEKIKSMLDKINVDSDSSRRMNTSTESVESDKKKRRFQDFEDNSDSDEENTNDLDEIGIYLSLPVSRDDDICKFWREQTGIPKLKILARFILAIPASASPPDTIFPASGCTLSSKRSQLKALTMQRMLFLHGNPK